MKHYAKEKKKEWKRRVFAIFFRSTY